MSELDLMNQVRILIFRCREKGLEVFLLNDPKDTSFHLPAVQSLGKTPQNSIVLEPVNDENGTEYQTIAFEGDYHDIPSIRKTIKQDLKIIKSKINEVLPDLEKGHFVAAKEIFKKILPNEYAAIKELKDILIDRNLVTNI